MSPADDSHLISNGGPALEEPTPFDLARKAIDDLTMEARNWLDGVAVENQTQADSVGLLLDSLRRAKDDADAARVKENEPFDTGKAAVQERYAPLIADTKAKKGKAVLAITACKAALDGWLKKQDDDLKAAAAKAKAAADLAAAEAATAVKAAAEADLPAKEAAEALVQASRKSTADAIRAFSARAHVAGGARSIGLTGVWKARLVDRQEAARHFWTKNPSAFDTVLQQLADESVRSGKRTIPGFEVYEDRQVR